MTSFKDYYETKEANEVLEEGFANVLGTILGIGTTGVLSAWIAALLFKGGVGAINSIAKTMGKDGVTFKKNFKEVNKDNPAVKKELNEMETLKKRYQDDIGPLLNNISAKRWNVAREDYQNLPLDLKNSVEIKRIIINEVMKVCGVAIIDEPTPGSESYQAIRKIIDLKTAKATAEATKAQIKKYIIEKEN